MLFGFSNGGEASIPASAPISPARAQPRVSIQPTRTPSSLATAALKAVARNCSPIEVNLKATASRPAAASTAAAVNRSFVVIPSATDPMLSPLMEEKADGKDRLLEL